jgi:hypothetical protein
LRTDQVLLRKILSNTKIFFFQAARPNCKTELIFSIKESEDKLVVEIDFTKLAGMGRL